MRFPAPAHSFPTKDEMADYLESYAARFALPVRTGATPRTLEKIAGGFGASDGLVRDARGRLIVTDYAGHRVFVLAKPAAQPPEKPQEIRVSGIESAADLTISQDGKSLLIPDMGGGKVAILPLPK